MKGIFHGRRLLVISVVVWVIVFFAGAIPSTRRSLENRKKIETASERIEAMASLSSAGGWFEEVVRKVEPGMIEEYDLLFPVEKQREQLFLQIASLALENGIDPFTLREIALMENNDGGSVDELADDSGDEDMIMLFEALAIDLSGLPDPSLRSFRLRMSFDSEYSAMAGFLSGLRTIPRALTLHDLDIEQGPEGITVIMELDYYARKPD